MLNFNYCECGCHGYEASVGNLHLWIFWDLKESYHLHRGHGWVSPKIKTCSSMEEAVELATDLARVELEKMQADLEVAKAKLSKAQTDLEAAPVKKPSVKTRLERI